MAWWWRNDMETLTTVATMPNESKKKKKNKRSCRQKKNRKSWQNTNDTFDASKKESRSVRKRKDNRRKHEFASWRGKKCDPVDSRVNKRKYSIIKQLKRSNYNTPPPSSSSLFIWKMQGTILWHLNFIAKLSLLTFPLLWIWTLSPYCNLFNLKIVMS